MKINVRPNIATFPFIVEYHDLVEGYTELFSTGKTDKKLLFNLQEIEEILSVNEFGKFRLTHEQWTSLYRKYPQLSSGTRNQFSPQAKFVRELVAIVAANGGQLPHIPKGIEVELSLIATKDEATSPPLLILQDYLNNGMLTVLYAKLSVKDMDYSIHKYLSSAYGLNSDTSLEDKIDSFPFQEGSIVVLYEKGGVRSETSPHGRILNQYLGKVTEFDQTKGTISIQNLNISGTLESTIIQYANMDDLSREKFKDMIKGHKMGLVKEYDLDDMGIHYLMYTEAHLITHLSDNSVTDEHFITSCGEFVQCGMTEADAIHYSLKQRDIEFDEGLYFKENPSLTKENSTWYSTHESIPSHIAEAARRATTSQKHKQILDRIAEDYDLEMLVY